MAGRSLVSDLSKKPTIPHIIRLCWEYTISRRWASNKPVVKLRRPLFTPERQRALFVSYRIRQGSLPSLPSSVIGVPINVHPAPETNASASI